MLKKGKQIISKNVVFCDNFLSKGTGLMFRSSDSVRDTAWVFNFNTSRRIHVTMWFVFFPIDILFVDHSGKIVEIAENVKPFSLYYPKKKSTTLIECEYGTVVKKKLKIGDNLQC